MKVPSIIGISGPPRSGKDTFCQFLKESLEEQPGHVGVHRMSYPLKLLAVQMLPEQKWGTEALKDEPMNHQGTTYRKVQIQLYHLGAELFGPSWLGHHFVRSVHNMRHLDFILMPDCGRPEDIEPLLNLELPFSHVSIDREGTSYEGDSRVAFSLPSTYFIRNNGTLEQLQAQAKVFARKLLC